MDFGKMLNQNSIEFKLHIQNKKIPYGKSFKNRKEGLSIKPLNALEQKSKDLFKSKAFIYKIAGTSMSPTLCNIDLLEINPYDREKIQIGDVVLFAFPEGDCIIAHRVVETYRKGFLTRGDNCALNDPWIVYPNNIIGKVYAARRNHGYRKITGGFAGLFFARLAYFRRLLGQKISRRMSPLYKPFLKRVTLCGLLSKSFKYRAVMFQTDGSRLLRVLIGKRVVGYYDERLCQWRIKPLFIPFIDKTSLPKKITCF
jgi:signal peptidase I